MPRKPVYFTFGNHMHWVDMQWLWGYDVLPGSVRDMLHLCRKTGIKGNVNFDAVGYEKMAAECPDALAELREAIAQGIIEPVGCSYGQPYGLFHGGESNIRQLTYGVRTTRRLLGVRPRAFWEEEFYFFPQLPQMLRQCGYTGACLFFQWTWHTPEVPREPHALILWEGIDGSRLPTLPRNELNLHQWPEDFAPLFESLSRESEHGLAARAIVQWVELMPSRDWMCRSEVLLPKLKELLANPEFEIVPGTLSEVIAKIGSAQAPVRHYTMDDVWHGMTLGKSADRHPRSSRACEHAILVAESLAATASLLGRPYAQWDVYPTWELEEAWRELLAAQHHDNHECEGLCGSIGRASFQRASQLAEDVIERSTDLLARRTGLGKNCLVLFNANGMSCPSVALNRSTEPVPAFGMECAPSWGAQGVFGGRTKCRESESVITLVRGDFEVDVDRLGGFVSQIRSPTFPEGALSGGFPGFRMVSGELGDLFAPASLEAVNDTFYGATLRVVHKTAAGAQIAFEIRLSPQREAVQILVSCSDELPRPDPGFAGALTASIRPSFVPVSVLTDTPNGIVTVQAGSRGKRKYPTGDWMTSPQWFEEVVGAFTSLSFVDLMATDSGVERGLLFAHTGSQQCFRRGNAIECVLNAYDPWDEERYGKGLENSTLLMMLLLEPHGAISTPDRLMRGRTLDRSAIATLSASPGDETVPCPFGPLSVEGAPSGLATAFHRESSKSGEHFPDWVGHEMARRSGGACTHPFVIRLVEYDGVEAEVTLKLVGAVATAAKTNLMGEVPSAPGSAGGHGVDEARDFHWLDVAPADPPDWAIDPHTGKCYAFRGQPLEWSQVKFRMRPREIATVYADMVMGRKEYRDLDAKREVWATVHRGKKPGSSEPRC